MNQQALKQLTIARTQLILSHGFFGMLALRLQLVERPDIPTLAVDGKHIFYNPEFVLSLSPSLTMSAMAHEVMHPALAHIGRRAGRNPKKWNYAGDYAINPILKDCGFEIAPTWLLDPAFAGMSADQIYNILPDDDDDSGGSGQEPLDDIMDGDPSEAEVMETDWKIAAVQAAKTAKAQAGKIPKSLERFIDDVVKPKVDWRDRLRRFITQISRDDYSWSRPNRRFLSAGMYLPGLYSESMGDIVIGVDTSGSIDAKTLAAFEAEVKAVATSVRPSKIHVVYCDAAINRVDEFTPYDDLKLKPCGGGGTAFKPVFDHVSDKGLRPECLIYLTDLYGDTAFSAPDYPTLWCCTTNQVAPFGETVHIEV